MNLFLTANFTITFWLKLKNFQPKTNIQNSSTFHAFLHFLKNSFQMWKITLQMDP